MKIIYTLIITLFFSWHFASAQDTLYIYRAGIVVTKRAVSEIDSISFNRNYSAVNQVTATDIDGNQYHSVKIGTQTWMVENLSVTKYRNGDLIPFITNNSDWIKLTTGGYCWYNNDVANKTIYGALYNWYTVADKRNIAPIGWHVASDAELSVLTTYLGGESVAGDKMKETGTSHWISPNSGTKNESGFNGMPGGLRSYSSGAFLNMGNNGYFWSTTESDTLRAWDRELFSNQDNCFRYYFDSKRYGFSVRCVKDTIIVPVIITLPITGITSSSAVCGGKIANDGGSVVTDRGICWSTTPQPTIINNKITVNSDSTVFSCSITGLLASSTYYVRAYATTSAGTTYGVQVSFMTIYSDTLKVSDLDGNVYQTVKIGNQTWMVENLRTTKYNDGTPIPMITDGYQWTTLNSGGYSWFNNYNSTNENNYGALYNWYAVNTGKLAPIGWHVPTNADINILTTYLNGYSVAGSKLKEKGNVHWNSENSDATNSSGFTALPGGYRSCETGDYHNLGLWGVFWSSSDTLSNGGRYMMTNTSTAFDYNSDRKKCGFSVRCIKDTVTLPVILTLQVTGITTNSAFCGGKITSNGGAPVTDKGICWSTTPQPTVLSSKITVNSDSTVFSCSLTGLLSDSIYYVRAYATNRAGTTYGEQVSFTTTYPDTLKVMDIDGNVYRTVKIGTQTWMAENLKTTTFNDGTSIPNVTVQYAWASLTTPGYCWFNDSIQYKNKFGGLYNWYTVNTGKLAPKGWHVATDDEWSLLTTFLGDSVAGRKLKETGTLDWTAPNTGATNETGFTALPGGGRGYDNGTFDFKGTIGFWWTSTVLNDTYARFRSLGYINSGVGKSGSGKDNGLSVRCVKDTVNAPVILTSQVTGITTNSAFCGGKITSNGGAPITDKGICWSTTPQPTVLSSKITVNSDSTVFSCSLTGLLSDSTYFVRAYATNRAGTTYGEQVSFTTTHSDTLKVTDIDGNVYRTVKIGTQTWMAENLRTTSFNDSTSIPNVTDQATWASLTTPGYCWFNDSIQYKNKFGGLYNWYAVNTGKLAPKGWHVATDNEWGTLTAFLDESLAGGKLKETGTLNWTAPNTGATNETGFTALPGGGRGNDSGTFDFMGTIGFWWTSTVLDDTYARFRSLGYNNSGVGKSGSGKDNGLYIRCIKD